MMIPSFSKTYDGKRILDFPGMELKPGKIYAILGANGSGKSTFAKILAGIIPADQKCSISDSVGYLPQKPYAFRMTVEKNLFLAKGSKEIAGKLLDALSLTSLKRKRANLLSGGETARVALARLMMKQYRIVVLDEPTASMDMETTSAAEALIRNYTKETDCILILVTHSLQQARRLADEALYFHQGKLLETGTARQILYCPSQWETQRFLEFYGN